MLVATNVLFLAEPVLLGRVIDALQGENPGDAIPTLALLMVVFALATAVTRILSRIELFNTARKAEYDLRADLFAHLLRFEPAFYRKHPTGDIMSRLTNDVQTVRAMWGPGILNIVNTAVAFITVFAMMIRIDPWLTLWAVLPYPTMVILGRLFGRRLYRTSRAVQAQLGQLSSAIQEDLSGVAIIKSYSLEDTRRAHFQRMSESLLDKNMDLTRVRGQLVPALTGMASISTVIVLWFGGNAVIRGDITLGGMVEFLSYLARLVWPTLALGWMLSLFQRGLAAWQRLDELLKEQPGIRDGKGPDLDLDDIRGDLEIRSLTVEMDGRKVLDDISLKMPAGSITAIVGRTGSGKSTLVEALPRLIDIAPQTIFLDGRDITELPLSTLRHAIGYAPQEAFLFSTTIAGNIAFGSQRHHNDDEAFTSAANRYDREMLQRAAQGAGLSKDLSALANGYETMVGERGVTLSGGQRQRVALARALATAPRVLVLDDSLSSVDAETEREILSHLTQWMSGRTAILISHRVAAVKRAHQIVCLDEGKVTEIGTHEELLAHGGVYADVYRSQLARSFTQDDGDDDGGDDDGGDPSDAGPDDTNDPEEVRS